MEFTVTSASITGSGSRHFIVEIDVSTEDVIEAAGKDTILDEIEIKGVVEHFGKSDVLDHIGRDAAINHFGIEVATDN